MLRQLRDRVERQVWAKRSHKFVVRNWSGLQSIETLADVVATMRAAREIRPVVQAPPSGKRIVIIAPHPDDEVIGPGGTMIGAIESGSDVSVIYLTSGSVVRGETERREHEANEAAKLLGYQTNFLRLPSLREGVTDDGARVLAAAVSQHSPDLLFVTFFADDHVEHQRASELLTRALDLGILKADLEVWAYQVYTALIANVIVDTTAYEPRKAEAIAIFESQAASRDWAHFSSGLSAFNSRFLPVNAKAHAEVFHVAKLGDYADLCGRYFVATGPDAS